MTPRLTIAQIGLRAVHEVDAPAKDAA